MVRNELVTLGVGHGAEGVVLAFELTGEGVEGRDDLRLNLTALLGSHGGTEGVVGEVSGDSDSGRVDHSILIGREVGASQLSVVHVGDVLVSWRVLVVLLNDLVEQRSKGVEALMATCVDTNARVGPFATGEDALLESVAKSVLSILASVPYVTCEDLGEERLGSAGEVGELFDLAGVGQVRAHHHAVGFASAVGHLSEVKAQLARIMAKGDLPGSRIVLPCCLLDLLPSC